MSYRTNLLAQTREMLAEESKSLTEFTTTAQLPEDGNELAARSRTVAELAAWADALQRIEAIHGAALGGLGVDERGALEHIVRLCTGEAEA